MSPELMAGLGVVLMTVASTYALVQLAAWIAKPRGRFADVDALAERRLETAEDYTGAVEYDQDQAA